MVEVEFGVGIPERIQFFEQERVASFQDGVELEA